jgi:hypothetical protein
MSLKEQSCSNDKASAKPQSRKPVTENLELAQQQTHPPSLIRRAKIDPQALSLRNMLQLQRVIGNRAVSNLLSGTKPRPTIQAKLTIGAAHDPYEQEADRVAAQVIAAPVSTPTVQRLSVEDELQTKPQPKQQVGAEERGETSRHVETIARTTPPQKVVQRGTGGGVKEGKGNGEQERPWLAEATTIADLHWVYTTDKREIKLNGGGDTITKIEEICAFAAEIYTACEEFMHKYALSEETKKDWFLVRKIWNAMDREMFILRKLSKKPSNIDEMGGVMSLFDYLVKEEENEYGGVEEMSEHVKIAGREGEFRHFNSQHEWEQSGQGRGAVKLRQGWKIHVSATPENAHAVSAIVLPILQGCGCEFKVVISSEKLTEMMTVKGQAGKYITIYPHDDAEALYIGYLVDNALQGQNLNGPHAGDNSEVMVGKSGLVFSRFGAYDGPFVSPTGLEDDNMEPDDRSKPYPSWKENIWK